MRSGCSSFVVMCNLSLSVRHGFSLLIPCSAYRAERCFRRLDPRFVKAAAVRSSGPGESSVTEKLHLLQRASPIDHLRTMEMSPPALVPPNVVVGATIVKRFPGYGERRGTIAEIDLDGGNVIVR